VSSFLLSCPLSLSIVAIPTVPPLSIFAKFSQIRLTSLCFLSSFPAVSPPQCQPSIISIFLPPASRSVAFGCTFFRLSSSVLPVRVFNRALASTGRAFPYLVCCHYAFLGFRQVYSYCCVPLLYHSLQSGPPIDPLSPFLTFEYRVLLTPAAPPSRPISLFV